MNIFILDEDPILAAQYQCDKHVVKMILESTQIMCTVQSKYGITTKYKPTHANHPCTKWAGENKENYAWLWSHASALCEEYTLRYNKTHTCESLINEELSKFPPGIPDGKQTPFVQAMPDIYKNENAVVAYRNYYKGDKSRFAKWKLGNIPKWY